MALTIEKSKLDFIIEIDKIRRGYFWNSHEVFIEWENYSPEIKEFVLANSSIMNCTKDVHTWLQNFGIKLESTTQIAEYNMLYLGESEENIQKSLRKRGYKESRLNII